MNEFNSVQKDAIFVEICECCCFMGINNCFPHVSLFEIEYSSISSTHVRWIIMLFFFLVCHSLKSYILRNNQIVIILIMFIVNVFFISCSYYSKFYFLASRYKWRRWGIKGQCTVCLYLCGLYISLHSLWTRVILHPLSVRSQECDSYYFIYSRNIERRAAYVLGLHKWFTVA